MSHIDIFESKIEELEKRIKALESRLNTAILSLSDAMFFLSDSMDLQSRYRLFGFNLADYSRDEAVKTLEAFMKNEKRLINVYFPKFKESSTSKEEFLKLSIGRINQYYPVIIPRLSVSFDEFSEMTFRVFGTQLAKKLFSMPFIIKQFGSDNAKRWKEL